MAESLSQQAAGPGQQAPSPSGVKAGRLPADQPQPAATTKVPGRLELFLGFAKIGALGFGGVGPWARHVIVEERQWLTEREYAEVLGMGQILPGPNVGNAAVMIGRGFHGLPGALLASAGLYIGPLCILIVLAMLYDAYGALPRVAPFMTGVAAAAAGMVIGMALKMGFNLKPPVQLVAVGLLAMGAAAWLRLPLPLIVVILAPLGIWISLRLARKPQP
ncbi:chromate transporter [Roseococcus pinisoli]|uniref:Chromate transporter n=1 Tax=Roseococcus pinisoli TaxID=2835040 RepID=A0ABS5QE17_9PROT|nr:chromate transporter [Roseococcus pinisoli]